MAVFRSLDCRSVYERFDLQEALEYDTWKPYRAETLRTHVYFARFYGAGATSFQGRYWRMLLRMIQSRVIREPPRPNQPRGSIWDSLRLQADSNILPEPLGVLPVAIRGGSIDQGKTRTAGITDMYV